MKQTLKFSDHVEIHSTDTAELDGQTGTILGIYDEHPTNSFWIVGLDEPMANRRAIVLSDSCLKLSNKTIEIYEEWIDRIQQCTSIKFNHDQIEAWLANNGCLIDEVNEYDFDTVAREQMCDSVARQFGFNRWPTYGDGNFDTFIVDLKARASGRGFEIED